MLTSFIIPVLALVAIFLFGIDKFSKQINQVAGDRFKAILSKVTQTPIRGAALGAVFTALIQSSTATTVILVGLIDAGVLSFHNSLGVIIGANIGTTLTSQLVALNITNIAPLVVLLGFLVTYFGGAYKHWGKPLFYFGLVFFSLSLISLYIEPIKSNPEVVRYFSSISNVYVAILVGAIFTAVVQSSSVTSGLVVVLVSLGLLDITQAIGVIMGANIGTTSTALLASIGKSEGSRKAAVSHLLFNVLGVVLFLPFINQFIMWISSLGGGAEQMVVNAHIFFNLILALIFLILIKPFERLVNRLVNLI